MTPHFRKPQMGPTRISGMSSLDLGQSHLRNPEYSLAREPLAKPVKEEDAAAREIDFDHFFAELLNVLGLDPNGTLPA